MKFKQGLKFEQKFEFQQGLEIVNHAINCKIARSLTEVEVALLFGAWNKLTYNEIAAKSGYSINYLQRDIGPKFWKLVTHVLGRPVNKINLRGILTQIYATTATPQPLVQSITDWGEALDVCTFHGRVEEIETLTQWILHDRCRLIVLVGMGGMGKSALATQISQLLQGQFELVIWRSLRNSPPLNKLLSELVSFCSKQQDIQPTPERLLYWLQTHRCLVILDNQETILQAGDCAGYYQPDFTNYGALFRLLGESRHQSCILLTSREKSAEIAILEDEKGSVRSLCLKGSWEASLAFIDSKKLLGTDAEKRKLCETYNCNPLLLKIMANSIQSLFDGNIRSFLKENILIFNGIRRLLNGQFERLSPLKKNIMYALAINQKWTTIAELQSDIVPAISRAILLESLESLTWRSLIKQRSGKYTQQTLVIEYVIDCLIQQLNTGLLTVQLSGFSGYALIVLLYPSSSIYSPPANPAKNWVHFMKLCQNEVQ